MCRIAYIPQPGLVEEQDLLDLFSYLEKTQGGEGNGLAMMWDENEMDVIKGLEATAEELAMMAMYSVGPSLFHTRRATSGPVCDALCQPLLVDGVATAHNGVWRDWDDVAMQLILQGKLDGDAPINDSLTAATLVSNFGRYTLETIDLGVFVVMTTEGARLHLRGGSFEFCPDLGIYASEFPKKDWPKSRPIRGDSIAFLSVDGPDFERGGWRTHTYPTVPLGGVPLRNWKDGKWETDADMKDAVEEDDDPVAKGELWEDGRWVEIEADDEEDKILVGAARWEAEDAAEEAKDRLFAEAQLVYYQRKYLLEEA